MAAGAQAATTPHPPNTRLVPDPPFAGREPSPRRERRGAGTTKVCVLGAGHGGSAMAGHLALLGFEVTVCSLYGRELDAVEEKGGVELVGEEVQGFGRYARIERSLDKAIAGQNLLMIASPGVAHRVYATLLAPILEDGQTVVLNPGRTGGALEFARVLERFACRADIVLGETQTFIYAAESRGPARVEILKEKFRMRAAALPASRNGDLLDVLTGLYPQIEAGENVLETSLNNVGGVIHPTAMLLNMHVLEEAAAGLDRRFYKNQVGPAVADLVMEKMDAEKCAVGRALRLSGIWTARQWYEESYHVRGDTLWDAMQRNPYYEGFHASTHLLGYNHILDEVPNSLVPVSELGRALGVPTPMTDAVIDLACATCAIDFRAHGRTLEALGLAGKTPEQMLRYVNEEPLGGASRTVGVARPLPYFA
jgi:opine dehydrogenase